MKGELVRVWTEDGLQLQGLYCPSLEEVELPAVLHVHGASSNFYRSQFLDPLADELTSRGYSFLTGNTRGHDIMNSVYATDPTASRRLGVAFELFEDSVLDIKTWLGYLEGEGSGHAVLIGHSLGASKAAFYQSQTDDERVKALIFMSPADLGYWEQASDPEMEEVLSRASMIAGRGQGESLISGPPLPFPVSANTLGSLFLSSESDIFRFGRPRDPWEAIAGLSCPILTLMGTVAEETVPDPEKAMTVLKSKAVSSPRCDTLVLEGAPHNYRGHENQVTSAMVSWLEDVFR